jgi:hypothetical protein
VGPVPDPLPLRKSGSAGNRTRDHRGSHLLYILYITLNPYIYIKILSVLTEYTRYTVTRDFPFVRDLLHNYVYETIRCYSNLILGTVMTVVNLWFTKLCVCMCICIYIYVCVCVFVTVKILIIVFWVITPLLTPGK